MQEEACILKVPCATLRDNTEKPETAGFGSNVLVGTKPDRISEVVEKMFDRANAWKNPIGDGRAGEWIVEIQVMGNECT